MTLYRGWRIFTYQHTRAVVGGPTLQVSFHQSTRVSLIAPDGTHYAAPTDDASPDQTLTVAHAAVDAYLLHPPLPPSVHCRLSAAVRSRSRTALRWALVRALDAVVGDD